MIILYILGALLAVLILYFLFLGVCALLVSPDKTYEKNSPFYRFLLESATTVAIKLLRIRVHISGIEKIPKDEKGSEIPCRVSSDLHEWCNDPDTVSTVSPVKL